MDKVQLKKFREYYFPSKSISASRKLMCTQFGLTERCARAWENGGPIQPWFVKAAMHFDRDEIFRLPPQKVSHKGFQGIKITKEKPRIITLLGSSRFCGEMAILAWEFEKGGAIALGLHLLPQGYCEQKGMIPDSDGRIHHIGEQEGVEMEMDTLHFKKIEMSDSVFVVNIGGYIGKSTAREIAYARYLGTPVSYLELV